MYRLYVKVNSSDPKVHLYYQNYKMKHEGDCGIDLITPQTTIFPASSVSTLNFGIQCKMVKMKDDVEYPVSFYLYPRSSITNTPLIMANSVGIIDSGYRGNIMAKLRNFDDRDFVLSDGSRLCQICLPNLKCINEIIVVSELDVTSRGEGGFGSTGI